MADINQEIEQIVAEMREVGKQAAPCKGGNHNNLLRYNELRERILSKFLEVFDAGGRLEMPTLTPPNDMDLGFDVIDTKTGEYPDLEKIALTEEWAQGLVYCDMDGFAVQEDGSLILLDECGNCVSCPTGRFDIRLQDGGDSTEGQIAMEGMKDDH